MNKQIKKVYCDTSVIGGVVDSEFSVYSKRFLNAVKNGFFNLVLSPVVDTEINSEGTPKEVRNEYEDLIHSCDIVDITQEALELQQSYLNANILTLKWEGDALHVALASVNNCDLIVSWNFRHIVNYQKIPLYNAINQLNGYREIKVYSPLELEVTNED